MKVRPIILFMLSVGCTVAVNAQTGPKSLSNPYQLQLAKETDYRLITSKEPKKAYHAGNRPISPTLVSKPYAEQIESAARKNNLDPALVHAVIHVESRHHAEAISPKGALGLMQVLPETALRFGVSQAKNPEANLAAGTRYLRSLLDRFDQRLDLALAAYNAGEGAVMKYRNQIPPYPETQHYVPAVMGKYETWREITSSRINYLSGTELDRKAVAGWMPSFEDIAENNGQ